MKATSSLSTDTSLLGRVQLHDEFAWEMFVELYGPLIFFWARRSGLQSVDAADVTQESLIAISENIGRFTRQGKGKLRGWLWSVTRNKIHDFHRKSQKAVRAGGTNFYQFIQNLPDQIPDEVDDSEQAYQNGCLLHRALAQVQAEFEQKTWNAFWNVVVEGKATDTVAQELNLSLNSVRQAKSRVFKAVT